jgi:hypothetical protein
MMVDRFCKETPCRPKETFAAKVKMTANALKQSKVGLHKYVRIPTKRTSEIER